MAKLKSSLLNMFLSLTIICLVSGAVLAAINQLTIEPINASKKAKLENAIKAVVPDFDNIPSDEAYMIGVSDGDSLKVYPAKKGNELTGIAIESNTMNGFSGEIKIIVGLTPGGKVINYAVLEHAETPGLGDKMNTWFKTDKNKQSIIDWDLSQGLLKVSKDGGDVDAITAATISSRAFLDAVNRAYSAYSGSASTDGDSGASSSSDGSSSATTSIDENKDATMSTDNQTKQEK